MLTFQEVFPNIIFGFTAAILKQNIHPQLPSVILNFPIQKFILGAEALYLLPSKYAHSLQTSNTGIYGDVALYIATSKKSPYHTHLQCDQ